MSAPLPGQTYLSSAAARSVHEKFVDNINLLLLARRWPLAELAKRSGIPLRTVENAMARNTSPTLAGAAAIAQALDTTVDVLIGAAPMVQLPWVGLAPFTCTHTAKHLLDTQGNSRGFCSTCFGNWLRGQNEKSGLYVEGRRAYLARNPLRSADDNQPILPGHPEHKEPAT